MEKNSFLVLDIGTTAVKVCLVSTTLQVVAHASCEYQLITRDGHVELEAETYWQALEKGVDSLQKKAGLQQVQGVCITTQGETILPVAADGTPLHNAVVWLDGRAEKQAAQIEETVGRDAFYRATGVPECNGLCPVSKLLWFKQERPEVYEKAAKFLLLEDYILWRLTGRFCTEPALLATTGYYNIARDEIWNELLDKLGLDAAKLPEVLECGTAVGSLLPEVGKELGLPAGCLAVAGAMDQVCGALGAGNLREGVVTETTGTALCVGATARKRPVEVGFTLPVYRHATAGLQLFLPVCMTAGMALKWFRDAFCAEEKQQAMERGVSAYDVLGELAAASPPLANGVVMLPYLAGSLQPVHAPALRGGFTGIGLHAAKADFVRALMEGVAYMLRENLELVEQAAQHKAQQIVAMGGGAASALWCQIKADVTGVPVAVAAQAETASIGAAMLCGVGLGVYNSLEEAAQNIQPPKQVYKPDAARQKIYEGGYRVYLATLAAASGMEAKGE